eukprot:scaffold130115_cov63-Phaeocystis_antarctica.AAC.1
MWPEITWLLLHSIESSAPAAVQAARPEEMDSPPAEAHVPDCTSRYEYTSGGDGGRAAGSNGGCGGCGGDGGGDGGCGCGGGGSGGTEQAVWQTYLNVLAQLLSFHMPPVDLSCMQSSPLP